MERNRGREPRRVRLRTEVAIIGTGVVTYFGVRGLTEGDAGAAREHAEDLVALERRLGLDVEHAVQAATLTSDLLVDLSNWVYVWGHWPVIIATLLLLLRRSRTHYLRLRNAMLVSGGIGLVLFAAFPVAPPRLAGLGLVDTVLEQSGAYRVLQPPAFVNQYAALPSLHVGWDLLVGMALVSAGGTAWLRWVGRLLPVAMALAVVATANHFLLDVVGGVLLALTGHVVALAIERRVVTRREPRPAEVVRADPAAELSPWPHGAAVPAPRVPAPRSGDGVPGSGSAVPRSGHAPPRSSDAPPRSGDAGPVEGDPPRTGVSRSDSAPWPCGARRP